MFYRYYYATLGNVVSVISHRITKYCTVRALLLVAIFIGVITPALCHTSEDLVEPSLCIVRKFQVNLFHSLQHKLECVLYLTVGIDVQRLVVHLQAYIIIHIVTVKESFYTAQTSLGISQPRWNECAIIVCMQISTR